MSSGIGDRDDLEALGINVILHNPSVGRNFSDHPSLNNISFALKTPVDDGPWIKSVTYFTARLTQVDVECLLPA
jgi:choline dehydrogenase-like flavoprotein